MAGAITKTTIAIGTATAIASGGNTNEENGAKTGTIGGGASTNGVNMSGASMNAENVAGIAAIIRAGIIPEALSISAIAANSPGSPGYSLRYG